MTRYAVRRLLLAVPLLFGLSVLAFIYVRLIPGDPVTAMLGVEGDPELVAELNARYGFDQPILTQYTTWVKGLLTGDLGESVRTQLPVKTILVQRIPATLQLAVGGLLVGLAIAIPAGVVAGRNQGKRSDRLITSGTLFGLALPGFWLGTLLMFGLALKLRWLPSQGYVPLSESIGKSLETMVLPSLTLGLAISPYLARLTRSAVIDVAHEPFMQYARAKGLSERTIAIRYSFRNVIPVLIVAVGLTVGFLLSGSIVVEVLFNWPGTGRLVVAAVSERDYAMLQALFLVYGVVFVTVNLCAELAQGLLDPRIRLS